MNLRTLAAVPGFVAFSSWLRTVTRDEGTRCYVHLRADDLEERFPGLLASVLSSADEDAAPVGLK